MVEESLCGFMVFDLLVEGRSRSRPQSGRVVLYLAVSVLYWSKFGADDGQLDQAALAAWLGAKRRHKALRQELGGPGGGAAWFH